jgi:hypothetical protein
MAHISVARHTERSDFGEKGVGNAEEDGQQGRGKFAEAQAAQRPEGDEGQDGDVHSGDHEDVVSAGALEIDSRIAVDEGFFADDHGVNECGLRRGPKRADFGDDAGVNAGAPEFETVADEAGIVVQRLRLSRMPSAAMPLEAR